MSIATNTAAAVTNHNPSNQLGGRSLNSVDSVAAAAMHLSPCLGGVKGASTNINNNSVAQIIPQLNQHNMHSSMAHHIQQQQQHLQNQQQLLAQQQDEISKSLKMFAMLTAYKTGINGKFAKLICF